MAKIDYKKELKHLYKPSAKVPSIVEVPKMNFLRVDGSGNPNTAQAYKDAIEALYPLAYALKFKIKKTLGIDYGVMPLEGLWWADDMASFISRDKDAWLWSMMIMQPEFISSELVEEVRADVAKKKTPAALNKVKFAAYAEGLSVQIFYTGSYDDEGPSIENMHDFAEKQGYRLHGKHHEIYLSDARKTAPEKLKTVLRQPIQKKLQGD
jgi:hypothetical protein